VRESSDEFASLLKKCLDMLKVTEIQCTNKHSTGNLDALLTELGFGQFDRQSNCDLLNKTRKDLLAKILLSHGSSYSSILEVLTAKYNVL
jgi:hypothetical protein